MKARFIAVNVFNHQLYTHQKWLSEMYENRVHFKFLFGPIYLFTPFPPILSWLCLCVWKKHLQPKSRCASHGSVAGEHHCILSPYGCWFTVMEGSNWPWKSSRPHQQLRLSPQFPLKDAEIKLVNQVSYTFKNVPEVVRVPRVPISAQCSCDMDVVACLLHTLAHTRCTRHWELQGVFSMSRLKCSPNNGIFW